MAQPKLSIEIMRATHKAWLECNKNITVAARISKLPRTTFNSRLDEALRILNGKDEFPEQFIAPQWTCPKISTCEAINKVVIIGGDLHIWPGEVPIMWKAFAKVAKLVKANICILNGDIIDGARVSRHGSFLGSAAPKLSDEIEAARICIDMLPRGMEKYWTMGNHDQRVDTYLANNANELADYSGRLSDRFPEWKFSYAVMLNEIEVRHRFRGGIHATWNNALHAGISIVTNHTHQQQVYSVRNRNGSHWGIETGMLGDPNSPAFEYTEGAPSRAHEGFTVLTFDEDGLLMPPEQCEMLRGRPVFRGKYIF